MTTNREMDKYIWNIPLPYSGIYCAVQKNEINLDWRYIKWKSQVADQDM